MKVYLNISININDCKMNRKKRKVKCLKLHFSSAKFIHWILHVEKLSMFKRNKSQSRSLKDSTLVVSKPKNIVIFKFAYFSIVVLIKRNRCKNIFRKECKETYGKIPILKMRKNIRFQFYNGFLLFSIFLFEVNNLSLTNLIVKPSSSKPKKWKPKHGKNISCRLELWKTKS